MTTRSSTSRSSLDATFDTIVGQRPERFDVVVIGGGQAGLAAGYHLAREGINFMILDAHPRVGDAWRNRWDSLTLFTPSRFTTLPGMSFPGPPWAFPTKDEVADYLERYATDMGLPVRHGVRAWRVSRAAHGKWIVETTEQPLMADAVIIATGGYQIAKVPEWADGLDPSIRQLHSTEYRNPSQLQPGKVLVVGASHSGAEIAVEVGKEHPTVLAGRDTGQLPFTTGGRIDRILAPLIWFMVNHVMSVDTPMGRKAKKQFLAHGFPLERPRRSDIAAAGVERVTARVSGARNGKPVLDDGRILDVQNVIWCTGFTGDYSWIDGVTMGDNGFPEQDHGVATGPDGLYFVGLRFQRAAASSLVGGVGRDAAYVADRIAARVHQRAVM